MSVRESSPVVWHAITVLLLPLVALLAAALDLPVTADPSLRTSGSAVALVAVGAMLAFASLGRADPVWVVAPLPALAAAGVLDATPPATWGVTTLITLGWSAALLGGRATVPLKLTLLALPPALAYLAADAGEPMPAWVAWTPTMSVFRPSTTGAVVALLAGAVVFVLRIVRDRVEPSVAQSVV